jgi:hypothetical protein
MVDDEHAGPTRLELIAAEAGVDADEYRLWLEAEVQRRRRERALAREY